MYLFIVKVGPKIMENRQAYSLREVLIVVQLCACASVRLDGVRGERFCRFFFKLLVIPEVEQSFFSVKENSRHFFDQSKV